MRYPLMKNNLLPQDLAGVINLLQENDPKLTAGPRVAEFESNWSDWLGVKYSVFVNSGSSANLLAIAWLKTLFPHGGRVIVPPFTWSSDISSVLWMGFTPEFVDIALHTLSIDEIKLENALNKYEDIKAVFITHAQGINGLSNKIIDLCLARNILLIEDVCESHGVVLPNGSKAGSQGILSCFSFYYAHHMSTIEGGMVCTNDYDIYQYLRMARSHGMLREATSKALQEKYYKEYPDLNSSFIFPIQGFNVRNNEIGAIIGISQLNRLDEMVSKRAFNFEYFLSGLPSWAYKGFDLEGQSNYAFNLFLNDADPILMKRLESTLNAEGIEFRRGSAGGGNQVRQPYISSIPRYSSINPKNEFPIADHIHFFGMYLGNYPELQLSEIDWLLKVLKNV
tara:strand:- start:4926 stop:6110 length:1185 start_codon:yes stop_codon:yes gene_type:complete